LIHHESYQGRQVTLSVASANGILIVKVRWRIIGRHFTPPSKSRIVEEGWCGRSNFQASYELQVTPEGLKVGNAILKAMSEEDQRY
jgi:hypothetical protein